MIIKFRHKGNFSKADKYFSRVRDVAKLRVLEKYAEKGVNALASATPIESGKTASSWYSKIERTRDIAVISFYNSHVNKGVPIAIILQYGHGTGTGGWVQGRDYINPAIQPIFDQIVEEAWKEVTKL